MSEITLGLAYYLIFISFIKELVYNYTSKHSATKLRMKKINRLFRMNAQFHVKVGQVVTESNIQNHEKNKAKGFYKPYNNEIIHLSSE